MQELLEKYLKKIEQIKEKQFDLGPYDTEIEADLLLQDLLEEAGFKEIVDVYISLTFPEREED